MRVQLQGLVDHVLLGRLAEPEELGRRKRSVNKKLFNFSIEEGGGGVNGASIKKIIKQTPKMATHT